MGQPAYTGNDEPPYTGLGPRNLVDQIHFNSTIEVSIERLGAIKVILDEVNNDRYVNEAQQEELARLWNDIDSLQYKLEMMNKG